MSFRWRDLRSLLEDKYRNVSGFPARSVLDTDYNTSLRLAGPITNAQHDYEVFHFLLKDADNEKLRIQVEQIIGGIVNKKCFLEEVADDKDWEKNIEYSPPLSIKYQLIARYFFYRGRTLFPQFEETVKKSLIREFPKALEFPDNRNRMYFDRPPLVLELRTKDQIRSDFPTTRIRILALRSADMNENFVFKGSCQTWLTRWIQDERRWDFCDDVEIVELLRQGNNLKKGTTVGSNLIFECSFHIVANDIYTCVPNEGENRRTKESFEAMNNIAFSIVNLGIRAIYEGSRKDAQDKFALSSCVALSLRFHDEDIIIQEHDPLIHRFEQSMRPMQFELSVNKSKTMKQDCKLFFPFVYAKLRTYHEEKLEVDRQPRIASRKSINQELVNKEILLNFLPWKCIRKYLKRPYHKGNVLIRKHDVHEVKTLLIMLLSSSIEEVIRGHLEDPTVAVKDIDDQQNEPVRRKIERFFLQQEFRDKIINGVREPFRETLSAHIYRKGVPDEYRIFESDFTSPLVDLSKPKMKLGISFCEWLQGKEDILGGNHLHSSKSEVKMTAVLFERHILTSRFSPSAIAAIDKIHRTIRGKKDANVIQLQFNPYSKHGLIIRLADALKDKTDADEIDIKTFNVDSNRSPADMNSPSLETAKNFGVVVEKDGSHVAAGLYVFLRRKYNQFPYIIGQTRNIMWHSTGEIKRKAIVCRISCANPPPNKPMPVYQFDLTLTDLGEENFHSPQTVEGGDVTVTNPVTFEDLFGAMGLSEPQPVEQNLLDQQPSTSGIQNQSRPSMVSFLRPLGLDSMEGPSSFQDAQSPPFICAGALPESNSFADDNTIQDHYLHAIGTPGGADIVATHQAPSRPRINTHSIDATDSPKKRTKFT